MFPLKRSCNIRSNVYLVQYKKFFLYYLVSAAEKKTRETSQKPVFMGKLMNTALITDSSASMMVHVKGNPNPEVKFMKDGADLKEDARVVINRDGGPNGTYEIIIKKVQTGDAGSYTCVASNSFGNEECVGTVTVKGWVIFVILLAQPFSTSLMAVLCQGISI